MQLDGIAFAAIDWEKVPAEEHPGERGSARSQSHLDHGIRVRRVEYSPGYRADHWCSKGHIVLCIRGDFVSEHRDGSLHVIREGMSYVVGDNGVPHRSFSEGGATLFIVD